MSKLKSFTLILGVFTMSFLIGYLVLAWQEPTNYPPETNVSPPLNTSTNDQTKPAGLTFTTFWDYNQSQYFVDPSASFSARLSGDVGIGLGTTETPGARLDIKPSTASALRIGPYGTAAGNTGEIRLMELAANGSDYIGLKAPDSIPAPGGTFILPSGGDKYLKSTTSGVLSWDVPSVPWPLLAPDGSESAPSYSFLADPDTGIYRRSSFPAGLAVTLGGEEKLRFYGDTVEFTNGSPKIDTWLQLVPYTALPPADNGTVYYKSGTGFQFYDEGAWKGLGVGGLPSGTSGQTLRHDGSSWVADSLLFNNGTNIGIGTTSPSPSYTLDINGAIATPYLKSPSTGDVNKDGDISSYDIYLVAKAYGCHSTDPCWTEQIGADNLANYLYGKDADLNGDDVVDIYDMVRVTYNYVPRVSPYTRDPETGDINKDGYVNAEDIVLVVKAYGCHSTDPCWTEQIGADNLANYLYGKDADLNGDDVVDMNDVTTITGNYEPYYFVASEQYEGLPAAQFGGDTIITNAGYLQIKKTSNGAPPAGDCDEGGEIGRFAIDTTNNRLYICMGTAGWKYAILNP